MGKNALFSVKSSYESNRFYYEIETDHFNSDKHYFLIKLQKAPPSEFDYNMKY